jgi:hypothetical protein
MKISLWERMSGSSWHCSGDKIKENEMVGHVVHMGEMHTNLWSDNLKERDHLEDLGIDGKIVLE